MVDAAPFRGLRYDPRVAGGVGSTSAPAYEELERFAYARHRTASPYTVVELIAPRGGRGYRAAAQTWERWRRTGVLVEEPAPAFYLYEEHELRGGVPAMQRGVLAAVSLEPLDGSGAVHAHEDVDAERAAERLARLEAVPVDLSPVFAIYDRAPEALGRLLDDAHRTPPVVALTDEAGVDHRVWAVREPATIDRLRGALAPVQVVIADGHHRYASALEFRRRAGGPAPGGDSPRDRILMYLVDARTHGPRVGAIHRLARALPPSAVDRLRARAAEAPVDGGLRGLLARLRDEPGPACGLRMPGGDAGVLYPPHARGPVPDHPPHARGPVPNPPHARGPVPDPPHARGPVPDPGRPLLDVDLVTHALSETAPHAPVEHVTDPAEAAAAVDADPHAALFVVRPVPADRVFALAAAGHRLPPKTTWFRPKPRTGLVMRAVAGQADAAWTHDVAPGARPGSVRG
ncbi:DUF1015 domain-containing protein [soil metagenome]